MKVKSPTLLMILDGWGIAPPSRGNAITLARTPFLDSLYDIYPSTTLGATGKDVGLEDNRMSGSESGHMNIGAGRVVPQDSYFISKSIQDKSFFMNPALSGAVDKIKVTGGKLHVMGLMGNSDSPHSDPKHFQAVLKLAKENGAEEVFCHLFTDGRDSYPKSALEHLKKFRKIMEDEGIGKIATLSGRFYAMDRTKNWDRLMKTYEAITFGKGKKFATPEEAINDAYQNGLTDEYLLPCVLVENEKPIAQIKEGDSVIFYNFRSDRARQLTKLFVCISEKKMIQDKMPPIKCMREGLYFAVLTDFGPDLDVHTAFPSHTLEATLPMALHSKKQLYTSESEKYAHVTYFMNGGYADPVGGEERIMIESPKVSSYADCPQMSAELLSDNVRQYLEHDIYDFVAMNFANADMVGHTGSLKATVQAVEFLDTQIKKLVEAVLKREGNVIITADHGNADDMVDFNTKQPNTFHTKNPVPFLLVSDRIKDKKLKDGGVLGNIAPTVLDILEIEKPKAMKKDSLL